jgi:hypothetical protein
MKKIFLPFVLLLVGLGLGYSIPHGAKPQQSEQVVGGAPANDRSFVYGLHVGLTDQYGIAGDGTATISKITTPTIGTSTVTPDTLTMGSGFLAIPSGQTVYNASSTLIDANSFVVLSPVASATATSLITALGSTLCNAAPPSTTVVTIFASSTAPQTNGFSIKITGASSRPFCDAYIIRN